MAYRVRRRTPLVVGHYTFSSGGSDDYYLLDIVNDPTRGLGTPAKSLAIINHGKGAGQNRLYFRYSEDGRYWGDIDYIEAGRAEIYDTSDNCIFWSVHLWGTNANMSFSLRAVPGYWSKPELKYLGLW